MAFSLTYTRSFDRELFEHTTQRTRTLYMYMYYVYADGGEECGAEPVAVLAGAAHRAALAGRPERRRAAADRVAPLAARQMPGAGAAHRTSLARALCLRADCEHIIGVHV